jgi:peptidoglycan LD-endopeptidase LytH
MSLAGMDPDPSVANGAEQRRHPALKHVLSLGGALFGGACIFVFMFCPQLLAADTPAAITPPQQSAQYPSQPSTPTTAVTPVIVGPTWAKSSSLPLLIPVVGIKASQLTDTYTDARSNGRIHDGIDIMAPSGTKVIAADEGTVVKLFYSNQGGLTVYEFNPRERFIYYYAHLECYAPGLVEGKQLRRGDPIGLVGSSGNASEAASHLHFEVSVSGPEKLWWKSTAINPYPLLCGH